MGFPDLTLIALLGACSKADYTGDGRFVVNGPTAATERYVIELGQLDLSHNRALEPLRATG